MIERDEWQQLTFTAKQHHIQESLFLAPPEEGFSAVCEQGVHIYVAYKMPWHSAKVS